MADFNIQWLLKPLPVIGQQYTASIVLERYVDGEWTEFYTTTEYKSNEYYNVPADSSGSYRVKVDVTFLGRRSEALSGILNLETYPNNRSISGFGENISSAISKVYYGGGYDVVRSTPKKIQYEANDDTIANTGISFVYNHNGYIRTPQSFQMYSVQTTANTFFSPLINISKATTITRLNGSSIGN